MQPLLRLLIAGFLCVAAVAAQGSEHTQPRLVLNTDTATPGSTVLAGLHLRMDPEWHVYWKNSGASGIPTTIQWELPPGITAGAIQWPVPEKIPPDDLATYAYHGEVVLLVPLTIAPDAQPGSYELKAHAEWLECRELCLPGSADLSVQLKIGPERQASADAALIDASQKKLPRAGDKLSARAWWEGAADGNTRRLVLEWKPPAAGETDFFPGGSTAIEVQGPTERASAEAGAVRLLKDVKKLEGEWPDRIAGLLVQTTDGERVGYEIDLPIAASAGASGASAGPAAGISQSLWKMLLYAFLGGLILNVMPCVLPVIALKILGFVNEARNAPRHARNLGLIYALGVLVSFLALAGLVIGVQAAGKQAGWGMQFSNPYFLIAMTLLVFLIALNLFGVFEVTVGGRAIGAASALSTRHGAPGAFFNGLLATVLATSCTAPFLGAAVGFAFAQPPFTIILIMLMVGFGLALPYVMLTWQPAWLKFLPKPGAWMERFKIAMGFPMLAAGIWLLSIVAVHYGDRTWWLAMFLVIVAVALWIFGEFVQQNSRRQLPAIAAIALLLITGYIYAFDGKFRWREPITEDPSGSRTVASNLAPEGFDWRPWSLEAIEQARAAGRPVIVDFTAKWCINCQTIVKPALANKGVRRKLEEINAVALLADYTRRPEDMTAELRRFGRAGVPLVLVYPANPEEAPTILPEALTAGIVLNALDRAAPASTEKIVETKLPQTTSYPTVNPNHERK